jgi:hypothetical protein
MHLQAGAQFSLRKHLTLLWLMQGNTIQSLLQGISMVGLYSGAVNIPMLEDIPYWRLSQASMSF